MRTTCRNKPQTSKLLADHDWLLSYPKRLSRGARLSSSVTRISSTLGRRMLTAPGRRGAGRFRIQADDAVDLSGTIGLMAYLLNLCVLKFPSAIAFQIGLTSFTSFPNS